MPFPLICPRCRRTNPENAIHCYFDGAELRAVPGTSSHRLGQGFVFPSGRRCTTYDEFAQACRDEWSAARDALHKGQFRNFFASNGRADLVKAADDATAQADADIALIQFLSALPLTSEQTPKLDISPRRLLLGSLIAGESRRVVLTILNQGQGVVQGTISVGHGDKALRLGEEGKATQVSVLAPREAQIALTIDTRKLPAGTSFAGRLTVITNGGVAEVPVRFELLAHPFGAEPLQGAKTPRELAELMRTHPKGTVPLLETGAIARWFTQNGWNYPVQGAGAFGVAGVQQFFEALGLSRPPIVHVAPTEIAVVFKHDESVRSQITLRGDSQKWIYAHATSDRPWLKVVTPNVVGAQHATISFEVDPVLMNGDPSGSIEIVANAGQTFPVAVRVEKKAPPAPAPEGSFTLLWTFALAFFLLRFALIAIVDVWLGETRQRGASARFLFCFVLTTGWLGAVAGALFARRRGLRADIPWAAIAGAIGGHIASATFGSLFLVVDRIPQVVSNRLLGAGEGIISRLEAGLIAALFWLVLGGLVGLAYANVRPK